MSFRPSVWNNSAPTGRIFAKFYTVGRGEEVLLKSAEKIQGCVCYKYLGIYVVAAVTLAPWLPQSLTLPLPCSPCLPKLCKRSYGHRYYHGYRGTGKFIGCYGYTKAPEVFRSVDISCLLVSSFFSTFLSFCLKRKLSDPLDC